MGLSLQPISQMPNQATFRDMKTMSLANHGSSVQQVMNIKGKSFLLSAIFVGGPDLHWSFYSSEKALWSFPCADLEMIENMVISTIDQTIGNDTVTVIGVASQSPRNPNDEQSAITEAKGPHAFATQVPQNSHPNSQPPFPGTQAIRSMAAPTRAQPSNTGSSLLNQLRASKIQAKTPPSLRVEPTVAPQVPAQVSTVPIQQAADPYLALEPQPKPAQAPKTSGSTGVTLAGELSEVELANVIQSVAICRMTGKLKVHQLLEAVELYFDQGNLVHATLDSTLNHEVTKTGDGVLLELMTWGAGEFQFDPAITTAERTINRRMDGLLMEGAALHDHCQMLRKLGINMDSRPMKWHAGLTENEFEAEVKKGIPVNHAMQKSIYCDINGTLTIYDLTQRYKVSKAEWIPILVNLLTLELITFTSTENSKENKLTPVDLQEHEAMKAWQSIMSPESGILPAPLFMYLYLMEFERAAKCPATQFTIAVLDIKYRSDDNLEDLSGYAAREVMEQIQQFKNTTDSIGHFFDSNYIILMPHESAVYGKNLLQSISQHLSTGKIPEHVYDMSNVQIHAGMATAPFDSSDPGMLLKLAQIALAKAKENNSLTENVSALEIEKL